MHINDLRQVHDIYDHVYLSPHLDDAALSCGGAIARHSTAGARVLVVTICTAPPSPDVASPFIEEIHRGWGLQPTNVIQERLHEDELAMQHLAADSLWVGMPDAIYRLPDTYKSREALFGTVSENDPLLPMLKEFIRALRNRVLHATLYAPLGIGNHVDHQITHAATRAGAGNAVAFYEDFPYVAVDGALEQRLDALDVTFVSSTLDIDATLSRKIGAVAAYASQMRVLFGGMEQMEQRVRAYAEDLRPEIGTYGERFWMLDTQSPAPSTSPAGPAPNS